jgi:hypothetical protein
MNGVQGVGGSNPLVPTSYIRDLIICSRSFSFVCFSLARKKMVALLEPANHNETV